MKAKVEQQLQVQSHGDCLVRFRHAGDYEVVDKCGHNHGRWAVLGDDGDLYVFSPATQLQKDIWLVGEDDDAEFRERQIAALRWICFDCMTIQIP